MAITARSPRADDFPLTPGVLLGIGLGGFVDGIVLHQILQWHHMLTSAGYPATSLQNLELNTLVDGLFHASTWVVTLAGVLMLARTARRAVRWSWGRLLGAMLLGWGGFNLVEGIVDHHVLGLHHVRPGPNEMAWDLGFLAFGAALMIAGAALTRRGRAAADDVGVKRRVA
jgi:uncharacterized membrane protein